MTVYPNQVLLGHVAEGLNRGERFYVPIKHTVVTGMTEYGKTTAMETLFHNMPPKIKCLVFLTKRGEKRFRTADVNVVPPFFKPRYDWRYFRTLLESTMNEKLRFETPWIYRVCKLAKVEVRNRRVGEEEGIFIVRELLGRMESDPKAKDFDKNINTTLLAYMDEFLPVLKENQKTFSKTLDLKPGINVMDLSPWYTNDVIQMVVIRACMEELLDHGEDTATGIPEAWKTLPQNKNTPVKLLFEKYIREGATNNNRLYIDAQDLGGVDKVHLRQCDVWIMGHMKQEDEVKRIVAQAVGVKIKSEIIQMLPRGHFIVAAEDKVTKVYVWPHGINEEMSIKVAKGELSPEVVKEELDKQQIVECSSERYAHTGDIRDLPLESTAFPISQELLSNLSLWKRIEALSSRLDSHIRDTERTPEQQKQFEELMEKAKEFLSTPLPQIPPATFAGRDVTLSKGIVKVKVEPTILTYKISTYDMAGKIMYLAKEGFFNSWRGGKEIEHQLSEAHSWTQPSITVYKALEDLIEKGFIGKRKTDRMKYKLADFVAFEGDS